MVRVEAGGWRLGVWLQGAPSEHFGLDVLAEAVGASSGAVVAAGPRVVLGRARQPLGAQESSVDGAVGHQQLVSSGLRRNTPPDHDRTQEQRWLLNVDPK